MYIISIAIHVTGLLQGVYLWSLFCAPENINCSEGYAWQMLKYFAAAISGYVVICTCFFPSVSEKNSHVGICFSVVTVIVYFAAFIAHKRPAMFGVCQENKCEPPEKYGNNRLPECVKNSIVEKLDACMEENKPWLDEDLSLGKLAGYIDVSPHQLSQLLNNEFGKPFFNYINDYRIEEVCKLIAHNKETSILTAAIKSGFSSKTTFNNVFKKKMGVTPSEYRKSVEKKELDYV